MQALEVKAQADSLVEQIERIKVDAVAEADGIPGSDLVGKDAEVIRCVACSHWKQRMIGKH